jgi:S1-C subfamily serine protease
MILSDYKFMEDNIIQTIEPIQNQEVIQEQKQYTIPPQKKNIKKVFGFITALTLLNLLLLTALGGYTIYQSRQIASTNDQLKKINQQLGIVKDAGTKQAESSEEIQNKLNNINQTPKTGTGSNLPSNVSSFNNLSKSIVKIYNISRYQTASGTGTIIDNEGHILTNMHVIEAANSYYTNTSSILAICITGNTEEKPDCNYTAEVIGVGDEVLDLALLKINKKLNYTNSKFTTTELAKNDLTSLKAKNILTDNNVKPDLGTQINVLGYPGAGGDNISLTQGIYSGSVDETYFKTDAKVNSGNSGGAAFDKDDKFLGVPTAVSGGQGNIGLIIKAQAVIDFVKDNI